MSKITKQIKDKDLSQYKGQGYSVTAVRKNEYDTVKQIEITITATNETVAFNDDCGVKMVVPHIPLKKTIYRVKATVPVKIFGDSEHTKDFDSEKEAKEFVTSAGSSITKSSVEPVEVDAE